MLNLISKCLLISIFSIVVVNVVFGQSPFTYFPNDKVADVMYKMNLVNRDNCLLKSWSELTLPWNAVGQVPVFNTLHKVPWKYNRTNLLMMHNLAMNRGFFYSFILQRLNQTKYQFLKLPNLHYYYLSASADVSASPGIVNGSAVLFDNNCTYANWYKNLEFNHTLPLFGPKAWRLDDWNDELNWLRGEPSNYTLEVTDYGAGPNHNYTNPAYKFNPYIKDKERNIAFIPDKDKSNDQEFQYFYEIESLNDNNTAVKILSAFFGPPQPGVKESFQPVRFTRPYFDCGRSNKWIVTSVGPVIDVMHRYVPDVFKSVRNPQIVGITLMDIDFLKIDFNPCPQSLGNDPYYLTGQARCKPSTICEPLSGFGFQRGGYMCHCKPGYRLPFYQNGPFRGADIEMATEEEYKSGFECLRVMWQQVIPEDAKVNSKVKRKKRSLIDADTQQLDSTDEWLELEARKAMKDRWRTQTIQKKGSHLQSKYTPPKAQQSTKKASAAPENDVEAKPKHGVPESIKKLNPHLESLSHIEEHGNVRKDQVLRRKKRAYVPVRDYKGQEQGFDKQKFPQLDKLMEQYNNVSSKLCGKLTPDRMRMPGEVGYGSERVFEVQGRIALRLAHFLSAYYQNHIQNEQYGNLRVPSTIQPDHLFGEVIANVASDVDILSSGVFYDHQKFKDDSDKKPDLFAPYAFKGIDSNQGFQVTDRGLKKYKSYTEESWFRSLKERWGSNTFGLERFRAKPWIRSDISGRQLERYFQYPLYYRVPRFEDGYWTNPYFDCDGNVNKWVITYAAPFFGRVGVSDRIEFMGVVTVSVPLQKLDIDQCPSNFYTPNYFKNTATCDYRTTYCVNLPKTNFELGQYKCECRQGFEYPFAGAQWFYLGGETDSEYRKLIKNKPNRYETLICRESGAGNLQVSMLVVGLLGLLSPIFGYYQIGG